MYAFSVATIGSEPLGAMAYFRAGVSMIDLLEAVADWHFGGLSEIGSLLDFAGGYGRSTRFLVRRLPPASVTVGEIQTDALEFQAAEFGVRTLQSTTDPAKLRPTRTFDCIFVASLFTHLPDHTFGPWLARLWELVAPGGLLVFSVHDEVLNEMGAELPDGFAFIPANEITALSTDDYGTNFTSEAYVRRRLAEAVGPAASDAIRLPRGLCFMQDVWVVARDRRNPSPLLHENGPNGGIERIEVDGRRLTASGWTADTGFAATDAHSHAIACIEIHVNGRMAALGDHGLPRPDVAAYLGREEDPLLEASGWTASVRLRRRIRSEDVVTAIAVCEHGRRFALDSTRVCDALERAGQPWPAPYLRRRLASAGYVYRQGGVVAVAGRCATLTARSLRHAPARARDLIRGPRLRGERPG